MDLALPLDQMSVEEKIRAIERLWEDLAKVPANVPSPSWHRDVLDARDKRHASGQEGSIPWDKAKEEIRRRKP